MVASIGGVSVSDWICPSVCGIFCGIFVEFFFKVEFLWLPNIKSPKFFMAPCVSPLRGWHHATCSTCTWARACAVLWMHVPKLAQSNWWNSGVTSKWNYNGFWWPNWLKKFRVTPCVSPLRDRQHGQPRGQLCDRPRGLVTLAHEQLQSGITMGFDYRIELKFLCVTPCVSPLCGWQCAMCPTCTCCFMKARA